MKKVEVHIKGPGSGRETAIRAIQAAGLEITLIKDVTQFLTMVAVRLKNVEFKGNGKR